MSIIESVPNFSEGRDQNVIREIGKALGSIPRARLLDVDPGYDANRTVYTLAGEPEAVALALKAGARAAYALIDMSRHSGQHPRLGALDVLPIIPLEGITMEECSSLARGLARELAAELGLPFYLYARSAARPERVELSAVRAGGYESLAARLADDAWAPDFGPRAFNPRWGASVCGARDILIAWNINLDSDDAAKAKRIAARLRSARPAGPDGSAGRGPFPGLKAIGWYMAEYGRAQVSCNVCDFRRSPLAEVYAHAARLAAQEGCSVAGSELVGMAPLEALLDSGRILAGKGTTDRDGLVAAAVRGLGLDSLRPFDPDRRVLEYALRAAGA
jgi:glutamate formiminotransferase/formiminotetrahydrofolate cyclodeaminase